MDTDTDSSTVCARHGNAVVGSFGKRNRGTRFLTERVTDTTK